MPPSHLAEVLPTGAEIRSTGAPGWFAVVCANGGRAAEVPGTWSASIEWLVRGLAPRFPELRFVELRARDHTARHEHLKRIVVGHWM